MRSNNAITKNELQVLTSEKKTLALALSKCRRKNYYGLKIFIVQITLILILIIIVIPLTPESIKYKN